MADLDFTHSEANIKGGPLVSLYQTNDHRAVYLHQLYFHSLGHIFRLPLAMLYAGVCANAQCEVDSGKYGLLAFFRD